MKVYRQQDCATGLFYLGLGCGFAWAAMSYEMGAAARMGPGFFPFWLGLLLALIGAVLTVRAWTPTRDDTAPLAFGNIRPTLWVTGAVGLFGVMLEPLGLAAALSILVLVSALSSHRFNALGTAVNTVVLLLICWIAFVWGLKLQVVFWPPFLVN